MTSLLFLLSILTFVYFVYYEMYNYACAVIVVTGLMYFTAVNNKEQYTLDEIRTKVNDILKNKQ